MGDHGSQFRLHVRSVHAFSEWVLRVPESTQSAPQLGIQLLGHGYWSLRSESLFFKGRIRGGLKPIVTISSSQKAEQPAKRYLRSRRWRISQITISHWLVLVMLSASASAQNASSKSPAPPVGPKSTPALVANPFPQPDLPPAPPAARTPEQLPPRAPQVLWDGKQLSITSENSTLADILAAVRGRTHAVIDIPPGASAERVVAQLGPAPAREVLSSLLSGSNFNYVILASDTDEDAIQSVLLTPRGKADESMTGTAVASASGRRLAPGYAESSRGVVPDTQVEPGSENTTTETTTVVEAAAPSQQPGFEAAAPVSEGVQPPGDTTPQMAAPDAVPVDGAAVPGGDRPSALGIGAAQPATAGASQPASSTPQMVQDLQRMYQQRRQIQIQQNQNVPPSPN